MSERRCCPILNKYGMDNLHAFSYKGEYTLFSTQKVNNPSILYIIYIMRS
jgi:hypothetical protein